MNCKQCGKALPVGATSRRSFCDDLCRVQFNRALKAEDFYFDAMVSIRKLAKASKFDDLRRLQQTIEDIFKANNS